MILFLFSNNMTYVKRIVIEEQKYHIKIWVTSILEVMRGLNKLCRLL